MSSTTTKPGDGKVEMKYKEMNVIKHGDRITIPEGMGYDEACIWLVRQKESEEKVVAIHATLNCFPLDGLVALSLAMHEMYGFTSFGGTPGFWGDSPPLMVQIQTPKGIVTAPVGRLQPPKFEGGFLDTNPGKMSLTIGGEVRKKFEPEVKRLLEKAQQVLKEQSIYKGQAFILDLDYLNTGEKFHPINHAPKFMDVTNVNESGVLLNRSVLFPIESNIYTRIEQSEACVSNGIPLKHGALFAGGYGTGKTLTSSIIASKCVRNDWTFIYLKTTNQIATALKLAEMYAPAVVFCEDIDSVTDGERDADLNNILNTLDGVDTKDKPIITILTTNHVEKIEKAMMRPGRIDTLVLFTNPDAETAYKFVELYAHDDDGKSLLSVMDDEEKVKVGKALEGKIPAFIAEAVHKAKCYAIGKHGKDITGKVTGEAIVEAAVSQKAQVEMLEGEKPLSYEQKSHAALRHFGHVLVEDRVMLPDLKK